MDAVHAPARLSTPRPFFGRSATKSVVQCPKNTRRPSDGGVEQGKLIRHRDESRVVRYADARVSAYASVMSSLAARERWAVVFLGVLALLFAPATDGLSAGSNREARVTLGARILVPAGPDAIEGVSPKLAARDFKVERQRPRAGSIPLAVGSAAATLLLLWASFARGLPAGRALSPVAFRSLVPRGPPGFEAI